MLSTIHHPMKSYKQMGTSPFWRCPLRSLYARQPLNGCTKLDVPTGFIQFRSMRHENIKSRMCMFCDHCKSQRSKPSIIQRHVSIVSSQLQCLQVFCAHPHDTQQILQVEFETDNCCQATYRTSQSIPLHVIFSSSNFIHKSSTSLSLYSATSI